MSLILVNRLRSLVIPLFMISVGYIGSSAANAKKLEGAELQIPSSYWVVAKRTGVPVEILYSMALAESGKTLRTGSYRPYPWTLNVQRKPMRFDTREEAEKFLRGIISGGITNVDIGFMQANWFHHGHRFHSPESALDPWINLRTSANILKERLNSEKCKGSWKCAVGRYHSFRKEDARAYSKRVEQFYKQFSKAPL